MLPLCCNVRDPFELSHSYLPSFISAQSKQKESLDGRWQEAMEDANSVPVFTAEDEQRERQSLTEEERRRIAADLYGVETGMASLTVSSAAETSSNDSSAFRSNFWNPASQEQQLQQRQTTPTAEFESNMNLLNTELGAIPGQEKEAYLLAMLQCPDQVFGGWRGEVISEMQESGTFDAKVSTCKAYSLILRMCDIL